ncbi:MAG: FHA domain-containing protein, partial [Burkholderiales bacterium]
MSTDFVLVEVLGSHDRVASRTRVALSDDRRSFVIGRGAQADIVLDDEYVAARHVELQVSPAGGLLANDLDTLNGITIAGARYRGAGHRVAPGSEMLVGRTRLRIRSADESLAPEKHDDEARGVVQRDPAWSAGVGVVLCILFIAYTSWLGAPREVSPIFVYASMAFLAAAGVWIAVWGLITRVT